VNPIQNVSSQVTVTHTGFVRNRTTGVYAGTMMVQNTGSGPLSGPIHVVLTSLPGGVTMVNSTGTRNGSPYITLLPAGQTLAPGASAAVSVQFQNPSAGFISFTPVTLVGVF
jgi:hypothetical protein